jgi:membrane-associated protease RseP (regulator of RpoE activity)
MPQYRHLLTAAGFCVAAPLLLAQKPPHYSIGVTILRPNESCPTAPLFIGSVVPGSPAASAGVHPGDQVVAIDGGSVESFADASKRIIAASPEPIVLELRRKDSNFTLSVPRERSDVLWSHLGLRQLDDGALVPPDDTDAQIQGYRQMHTDLENAMRNGDSVNVFPGHYPADLNLYYPGFELFVWQHGQEVTVGGIENGPGRKSGISWGDRIVSVNGVDPRGKTLAQIEGLFSSAHPAIMRLVVSRFGAVRAVSFPLARASEVLTASGWRLYDGKRVPLGIPDAFARCFE